MNGEQKLRVFNKCKYDIGVTLLSGMGVNIAANNFIKISVDDILFIESNCSRRKYFSAGMLVPTTDDGKELTLEDIGGFTDTYTVENQKHFTEEDMEKNLKKPFNAFKAWANKIEDPSELHAVIEYAKKMDLPTSKMKVLQAMVPNRDLLDEDVEE